MTEDLAGSTTRILEPREVYPHFTSILSDARHEVVLAAPFLSIIVVRECLKRIQENVKVTLITRWRATEIAGGFNDLEVKTLLEERGNSKLRLLWNLHAKYYRGDSTVIFGSGNLTEAGLNSGNKGNSEVMVVASRDLSGLRRLEERLLESSVIPTAVMYKELLGEVNRLKQLNQSNGIVIQVDTPSDAIIDDKIWRPYCMMPDHLFDVYRSRIDAMDKNVIYSAERDLEYLDVPPGLIEEPFRLCIRNVLAQSPLFPKILSKLEKEGITDDVGVSLVLEAFENLSNEDAKETWFAIRMWLGFFFPDEFSYV